MSYICLIANEKGAAAAGDSRLTIYPDFLRLHIDKTKKAFADEAQGLVWACCGLTVYAGMNFFRMTERTLRDPHRSMAAKLNHIETVMKRATRSCHFLTRQRSTFTLLLCEQTADGPLTTVLNVMDGRVQKRQIEGPVAVEGGWRPAESMPGADHWKDASVEQMVVYARRRTMDAVKLSAEGAKENKKQRQTVGGNVRVVYLETK